MPGRVTANPLDSLDAIDNFAKTLEMTVMDCAARVKAARDSLVNITGDIDDMTCDISSVHDTIKSFKRYCLHTLNNYTNDMQSLNQHHRQEDQHLDTQVDSNRSNSGNRRNCDKAQAIDAVAQAHSTKVSAAGSSVVFPPIEHQNGITQRRPETPSSSTIIDIQDAGSKIKQIKKIAHIKKNSSDKTQRFADTPLAAVIAANKEVVDSAFLPQGARSNIRQAMRNRQEVRNCQQCKEKVEIVDERRKHVNNATVHGHGQAAANKEPTVKGPMLLGKEIKLKQMDSYEQNKKACRREKRRRNKGKEGRDGAIEQESNGAAAKGKS